MHSDAQEGAAPLTPFVDGQGRLHDDFVGAVVFVRLHLALQDQDLPLFKLVPNSLVGLGVNHRFDTRRAVVNNRHRPLLAHVAALFAVHPPQVDQQAKHPRSFRWPQVGKALATFAEFGQVGLGGMPGEVQPEGGPLQFDPLLERLRLDRRPQGRLAVLPNAAEEVADAERRVSRLLVRRLQRLIEFTEQLGADQAQILARGAELVHGASMD